MLETKAERHNRKSLKDVELSVERFWSLPAHSPGIKADEGEYVQEGTEDEIKNGHEQDGRVH